MLIKTSKIKYARTKKYAGFILTAGFKIKMVPSII